MPTARDLGSFRGAILGTLRAHSGHITGVNCGFSWSPVVTNGEAKGLANKGVWPNFLSTPNGIRTRAATLKGWKELLVRLSVKPDQEAGNEDKFTLKSLAGTLWA